MHYQRVGKNLVITADDEERETLLDQRKADSIAFEWDTTMYDLLGDLIANSELQWIDAGQAGYGDLTDAPMLGVLENDGGDCQCDHCCMWTRWAFMDYQVCSVQGRLADDGRVVFQGS